LRSSSRRSSLSVVGVGAGELFAEPARDEALFPVAGGGVVDAAAQVGWDAAAVSHPSTLH